jgi:hypothetical protein
VVYTAEQSTDVALFKIFGLFVAVAPAAVSILNPMPVPDPKTYGAINTTLEFRDEKTPILPGCSCPVASVNGSPEITNCDPVPITFITNTNRT